MEHVEHINIMVTGAAGFIGSHLVNRLLELKNKVIAYDNFDEYYTGKEKNLEKSQNNPHLKLVRGDILDIEELATAMKKVDVVFHLAAQPGVRFSAKNPWKTNTVNVNGTLNVLLAARKNGVKKMVFASSSSVYGALKYLPCDEEHPTLPISIYGASKLAAEKYCQTFWEAFGVPIVILRYHTVYGPRQRPDMAIYKFTKAFSENKPPRIYGDGNQTRDFTYVLDAVEGTILAAEGDKSDGQVFNIGTGSRVTINKVIALLEEELDKNDVSPIYEEPKLGDMPHTQADIRKARAVLGYNPKTSLREGIRDFIKWYTFR